MRGEENKNKTTFTRIKTFQNPHVTPKCHPSLILYNTANVPTFNNPALLLCQRHISFLIYYLSDENSENIFHFHVTSSETNGYPLLLKRFTHTQIQTNVPFHEIFSLLTHFFISNMVMSKWYENETLHRTNVLQILNNSR